MNHSVAISHNRPAGVPLYVVLGVLLGVVIGALGFAIVESTIDAVRVAHVEEAAASEPRPEFPPRELPREWQWQPSGVAVEHMYRQHEPERIDWIRENGGR